MQGFIAAVSALFAGAFGLLFVIAFLVLGVMQLWAGYVGIEFHLGGWWPIGFLAVALLFRFTLPMTIGAFFGATDVWHWHWALALMFVLPGLLFMVPAILGSMIAGITRGR